MTEIAANQSELRKFLWPIYGLEHKKFLPMTFMISMILFVYTILRNMKDALVVNSTGGSEIITALKLYAVLPSAIIAFLVITKLYNMFSRQTVFYIIVTFFITFFALFTLVLYPYQEALTPTQTCAWLREVLPQGKFFENFVNMYQYWSFSLFYILSELWGSVIATLLFWQFANSIVKVKEAKRFYAHFYLIANLATAFSGIVGRFYAKVGQHLPTEFERYGQTVHYTAWTVVLLGLLVMFLYNYLNSKVVTDPRLVTADEAMPEKKKLKLGVGESIKFIFQSKYLGLIAILVISYGITINLVEVAWKQEIHHLYPEKSHYNAYMNLVSTINGLTTFFVILIGGYLVRVMGWRAGALATPFALGITGVIFFYFMIFTDSVTPLAAILGTTALTLTVVFGTIQNVLSKSIKYALFDPTKEMSYIPLDPESKAKGKAAVDVVGGRLGKGGGAAIQQILFLITGLGTAGIAPYSASLLLIFTLIWIWAVFNLHKLFVAKGGEEVKPKA